MVHCVSQYSQIPETINWREKAYFGSWFQNCQLMSNWSHSVGPVVKKKKKSWQRVHG
jgi:hypothetical protein